MASRARKKNEPDRGGVPGPNVSHALSPWLVRVLLVLVLGTYFMIRVGYRDIPLERDEGTYIYMGARALEGGVPFVDLLEMKPAGLYYTYAILVAISGGDLAIMHIWMAAFRLLGALFLFGIARRWFGAGPALVAVVVYEALAMSAHASGFTMQAEHLVVLFALAGLFVLERGLHKDSGRLIMLAGGLISWSILIKQNAIFLAVFAVVWIALKGVDQDAPGRLRRVFRHISMLAAGAIVILTLSFLDMVVRGNLQDFLLAMMGSSRYYTSQVTTQQGAIHLEYTLGHLFRENPIPWIAACIGVPMLLFRGRPQWLRWALFALLLASVLTVIPGKRFFGHYFLVFFPGFALLAGHAASMIAQWTAGAIGERQGRLIAPLFAATLFLGIVGQQWNYYFVVDHTAVLRRVYHSNPFPESRLIADVINAQYQAGDGLYVMGSEPQIYLYTGTVAPTRIVNPSYLMHEIPLAIALRKELLAALRQAKPKYVVWVQHVGSWMPGAGVDQSFLEEYWNELHRDYEAIAWYEQDPWMDLVIVKGEEARTYSPRGTNFMFLMRRKAAIGADPVKVPT